MRYFSIVALATEEADLLEHRVILDAGMNVFSVHTEDIVEVIGQLADLGVTVLSVHALDEFDSVPPTRNDDPLEIPTGES